VTAAQAWLAARGLRWIVPAQRVDRWEGQPVGRVGGPGEQVAIATMRTRLDELERSADQPEQSGG
jgi:hypothetical protein